MELPEWSGERQRASLTGFARVRAVLWRRSLRLYEWWALRREPWFRPLRRELKRNFRGIDPFGAERVQAPQDVFGETPILTMVTLLHQLDGMDPKPGQPFVDLGCGRGVTCLVAASRGWTALGLEREEKWVSAAQAVADSLELSASFRAEDFTQADWPEGGTYLAVATAFDQQLKEQVLSRLQELRISTVITADWDLRSPSYELVWERPLPVDWGTAHFRVFARMA